MKTDNNLLATVQEALRKDPRLINCLDDIYILVNDGAVIVAGSVTHQSLKEKVGKIVAGVPGVTLLIDDLKIMPVRQQRLSVQIDWANGSLAFA